ncbi:hypothetical protein SETIT_8G218100v2 [Setaria italica]|uniref:Bifunctional inhibitor/plant lipid transfer protein/seed storage helical domain-containing protein n=1 Tax=Setaria italica TaxID=4555 RepID=A0A368SA97_SETIT|nr:hypothetical protein SETIT_8G218100v2 [Setaria italica]
MASANGAMLSVVACIALVLLSMGLPVMADLQTECRMICRPRCERFATEVCTNLIDIVPIVNLSFFYTTCQVRISAACTALCINICTLNTFTPDAPTPAPATHPPPPCKPY